MFMTYLIIKRALKPPFLGNVLPYNIAHHSGTGNLLSSCCVDIKLYFFIRLTSFS